MPARPNTVRTAGSSRFDAPGDRGPQRARARRDVAQRPGRAGRLVVQRGADRLERVVAHARRGQLDRQRQPVERAADLAHERSGRLVAQREAAVRRAGPFGEQRDRVVDDERRDVDQPFAREPERLARGRQEARQRRQPAAPARPPRPPRRRRARSCRARAARRAPPAPRRAPRPRCAAGSSRTPSARSTATSMSAFSASGARSTNHAPSAWRATARSATSRAKRVLPVPPGPSSVTRRCSSSRLATWTRSRVAADEAGRLEPQVGALPVARGIAEERRVRLLRRERRRGAELGERVGRALGVRPRGGEPAARQRVVDEHPVRQLRVRVAGQQTARGERVGRAGEQPPQHALGQLREALALRDRPVAVLVAQERAGVEPVRLGVVTGRCRLLEAQRIDRDVGREGDRGAAGDERVARHAGLGQRLADRPQRGRQARPRTVLVTLRPADRGQLVARDRPSGVHGQVHQQQPGLGGRGQIAAPLAIEERDFTQRREGETRHASAVQQPNHCSWRLTSSRG